MVDCSRSAEEHVAVAETHAAYGDLGEAQAHALIAIARFLHPIALAAEKHAFPETHVIGPEHDDERSEK